MGRRGEQPKGNRRVKGLLGTWRPRNRGEMVKNRIVNQKEQKDAGVTYKGKKKLPEAARGRYFRKSKRGPRNGRKGGIDRHRSHQSQNPLGWCGKKRNRNSSLQREKGRQKGAQKETNPKSCKKGQEKKKGAARAKKALGLGIQGRGPLLERKIVADTDKYQWNGLFVGTMVEGGEKKGEEVPGTPWGEEENDGLRITNGAGKQILLSLSADLRGRRKS